MGLGLRFAVTNQKRARNRRSIDNRAPAACEAGSACAVFAMLRRLDDRGSRFQSCLPLPPMIGIATSQRQRVTILPTRRTPPRMEKTRDEDPVPKNTLPDRFR